MKSIKDSLSLKFLPPLCPVQCTLQSHNFQALYSNISAQSGHNIPKYLNLFINGPRWDWLTIKMRVENLSWNTPFNVNAQKKDQPPPLFGCRNSRSYCLSPLLYHQLFFTAHFLRSHCARCNWVLDMCYLCMWGGEGGRGLECKAEKQLPSLYCLLLNNKSSSPPPRTSSSIRRWFLWDSSS